jgi:colicin import membrane protein
MPIRERIWAGVIVSLALCTATACDDDKEQAAKLAEVQRIADEKLKKSEKAAAEKVAELEKQVASLKADMETQAAKLKSEAEQAIGKAQADAEEQTKAAEAALKKAREAYKAEGRAELAQLNKQVQELAAKSAKAPAKVKTATQTSMKTIVKQQQQIAKDIAAFDKTALDGLSAAKTKLLQDLAKMKQTIAGMKAKLG